MSGTGNQVIEFEAEPEWIFQTESFGVARLNESVYYTICCEQPQANWITHTSCSHG